MDGLDGSPAEISVKNAPAISIPEFIGRFWVKLFLGQGQFGRVFVAHDPELERDVAVKVPKPGTLTTEKRIQRFLGDAKAAARLRHPHIVLVFDLGMHEGSWFIASAFVPGQTLAKAISEKSLDLKARIQIVRRLSEALDYAHSQGVIHRDVKPDDVMLDAAHQPHLIDFGLAKLGDSGQGGGRAVMGTPMYMSPEQADGRSHDADAKSDQYSLGVVLYELFTGQVPFSGPTNIVLYQKMHNKPPAISDLTPEVPRDLSLICDKTLAKDPESRYASCGQLADDLRRWLEGETPLVHVLTQRERLKRWAEKGPQTGPRHFDCPVGDPNVGSVGSGLRSCCQ